MSAVLNYLVRKNVTTSEALQDIKDKRHLSRKPLQDLLIETGAISEQDFFNVVRSLSHFPAVDWEHVQIDPEVIKLIPLEQALFHGVLPLNKEDGALRLAMSDPSDILAIDVMCFITDLEISPLVSTKSQLTKHINACYRKEKPVQEILKTTLEDPRVELNHEPSLADDVIADLARSITDDSSVIRLVNKIICDAIRAHASDVHIEPQERAVDVRYRVDGSLKSIIKIPRALQNRLVSRLKILAKLDIAEKGKIQEGRIKAVLENQKVDLRVSVIPTFYGEKVVLRILGNEHARFALNSLGFEQEDGELFRDGISKTQGVILVTGPTGSGKTTTIYTALQHLKHESINIITLEDPIEYLIDGINQIQLNRHKEVTFASGLKSLLRQDPDVLLVGEIRDAETAEAAFRASLTGHLVFSTLHTNSAVSTITRLMNIGVEPYLISSSLNLVVAQRLVRLICPHCRAADKPDRYLLTRMQHQMKDIEISRFYRGVGCPRCHGTGFLGRTSIFETLKIDDLIQDLILAKVPEKVIHKKALERGMRTMVEAGLLKVARGLTTLSEVVKVTNAPLGAVDIVDEPMAVSCC